MESYESWLGEGAELAILRMLGLFDRPAWLKKQAYAEYGITQYKTGDYEVDHLIPLSLGGSESARMGEREAVVVFITLPFSTRTVTTTSPLICRSSAVRGYSGVGCADAMLPAGIPTTTIGCRSAA
jgi:hypothetical protein